MSTAVEALRSELDAIEFSDEALSRLTASLEAGMSQQKLRLVEGQAPRKSGKTRGLSRAAAAAAVALALLAGCGVAYATGALPTLFDLVRSYFASAVTGDDSYGTRTVHGVELGGFAQPINQSQSVDGVTMTLEGIYGDSQQFTAIFTLTRDDGEAFENPYEGVEGCHAQYGFGIEGNPSFEVICKEKEFAESSWTCSFGYEDDSHTTLVYTCQLHPDVDAQGKTFVIRATDLVAEDLNAESVVVEQDGYSKEINEAYKVLAEGTWEFEFTVDFVSSTVEVPAGQTFSVGGTEYQITRIAVSNVGLTIDYSASSDSEYLLNTPFLAVELADGTRMGSDDFINMHVWGAKSTDGGQTFTGSITLSFDREVALDDIASITIGDCVIDL